MKLNVNEQVLGWDLAPISEPVEEGAKPAALTFASVLLRALNTAEQSDRAEVKIARFRFLERVVTAKNGDGFLIVDVEQAADIKAAVGRLFTPLVVGRVYAWVENPLPVAAPAGS